MLDYNKIYIGQNENFISNLYEKSKKSLKYADASCNIDSY